MLIPERARAHSSKLLEFIQRADAYTEMIVDSVEYKPISARAKRIRRYLNDAKKLALFVDECIDENAEGERKYL